MVWVGSIPEVRAAPREGTRPRLGLSGVVWCSSVPDTHAAREGGRGGGARRKSLANDCATPMVDRRSEYNHESFRLLLAPRRHSRGSCQHNIMIFEVFCMMTQSCSGCGFRTGGGARGAHLAPAPARAPQQRSAERRGAGRAARRGRTAARWRRAGVENIK